MARSKAMGSNQETKTERDTTRRHPAATKVIGMENAEFLPVVCQLVAEGKEVSIRAKGNSMRPFVESGRDVAILARVSQWRRGDVVLAEIAPGHYVLHRIDRLYSPDGDSELRGGVSDAEAQVRLRGDGNVRGTEQCRVDDLRALCVAFVRKGREVRLAQSRSWRVYSWLWPKLLPMRRWLLAFYRLLWLHQLPRRLRRLTHKQ